MSINSPCVRLRRLGECTIRLEYRHFLTTIAFRRVGSAWGPTISIISFSEDLYMYLYWNML